MRNLPEDLQATPELDYRSRDSSLIMRENSTRAAVSFSILPDDDAEDIESFFVVIYNVTLIGQSRIGGKPGWKKITLHVYLITFTKGNSLLEAQKL